MFKNTNLAMHTSQNYTFDFELAKIDILFWITKPLVPFSQKNIPQWAICPFYWFFFNIKLEKNSYTYSYKRPSQQVYHKMLRQIHPRKTDQHCQYKVQELKRFIFCKVSEHQEECESRSGVTGWKTVMNVQFYAFNFVQMYIRIIIGKILKWSWLIPNPLDTLSN